MNANSYSHNDEGGQSQGARPAKQLRSRQSRDKIVTAFAELLKEKPFERVSVAEIAERAGVAVGTLYRRFKNKDALIPVVFELYQERIEEWMVGEGRIELPDNATLRDALEVIVRTGWALLINDAHILRTAHLYARLRPEMVGNEGMWKTLETTSYQSFQPLLQMFPDEVKRKDIDMAAKMMTYFMNAFFLEKGLYPDESPAAGLQITEDEFLCEATDMLYGYFTTARK